MTNVIELFPADKQDTQNAKDDALAAEKEFLQYLMWSMKMEKDPHEKYDDPVTEFRARNAESTDVA